MTLRQVGLASFESCQSEAWPSGLLARSPEEIIRERARQRGQGPFGFLRTVDRRFDVRYDETGGGRRFRAIENQYLTAASANVETTREDPRCTEGPIPVQCRTAACGTCWVGVLAGESRLSPVDDREWRKMKEFGYLDSDEPHPRIRLACQARVRGCVTIVIPPWNGFFGSLRERAGAATRAQQ
jgi:ferredoxin